MAGALVWSRLTMGLRSPRLPAAEVRPTLLGSSPDRWPTWAEARRRARARMRIDRLVEALVWTVGLALIALLVVVGLLTMR